MKTPLIIAVIWLIVMLPIVEAQAISGVALGHGQTTTVSWTTDKPATGTVEFGNTTELEQNASSDELTTAHFFQLATTPGQKYFYTVSSCADGNCKTKPLDSFTSGPLYVSADIPKYPRSNKIDIPIYTRVGAEVSLIVNNVEQRKTTVNAPTFIIKNVELASNNTIVLKAALGTETAQATYQAEVDGDAPTITVTIPPATTSLSVKAKVKVSEPVNLTVTVEPQGTKPERPSITQGNISSNSVELNWQPVDKATDYVIYRNDKRIATVKTTTYRDTTVGANTEYQYQATSIGDQCIQSDKSDILSVKTEIGTNAEQATTAVKLGCEKAPKQLTVTAESEIPIELYPGENFVTFEAKDRAGFVSVAEERVIYDTGPPIFLSDNLKDLSPTYKQEVEVKGRISEPGSITVFLNGKPVKTEPTDSQGNFAIKVKLERPFTPPTTTPTGNAVVETTVQWKNKIYLEAIDGAGLKAVTPETEIIYALCGSGTWFDVQLTEPLPDTLNPRMLLEGIQQIGIGFNYTYRGGQKATVSPRDVKVNILKMGPAFEKDFDNGLITVYAPPIRVQRAKQAQGLGYIQVNFQPITDPWKLEGETAEPNATTYDKENQISKHREGECLTPELGCMKLFLELEIPFEEVTKKQTYDPQVQKTIEKDVTEKKTQKTCVNIEVMIDKRIPPDYIPSGFLKATSKTLTYVVDTIDKVLKPISTIGKYLFYTCVAGRYLAYVPIFLEQYNCKYKTFVDAATGSDGKFEEKVAEIGACDEEYGEKQSESRENCNTCATWKKNRNWFTRTYRQLCDRIACPAVPSLQYYLKTKGAQKPTPVNAPTAAKAPEMAEYLQEGKLLAGSDCAAWVAKQNKPTQTTTQIPPRKIFTYGEIKDLYQEWLNHEDDSGESTGKVDCAGPHPATPECCGFEYMREWSSGCGVSGLGSMLDTYDEIKQSTCLSAEATGENEITLADGDTKSCNKLLNSLSGFCDKKGGPPNELVRIGAMTEQKATELGMQQYGESRDLYISVKENTGKGLDLSIPVTGPGATFETTGKTTIKLGVVVRKLEYSKTAEADKKVGETSELTEKLEVAEYPGAEDFQTKWFSDQQINAYNNQKTVPAGFGSYLCEKSGQTTEPCPHTSTNGKPHYDQVMAIIGSPEKEYIIKPNEGLFNSIRCICFPTLIGYLKMYKTMFTEVRNCVNTIMLTGDGSNGVCTAVISKYACDLLYEALTCFTQKFTSGNKRMDVDIFGGDVVGALTASGTEMSREVEDRYGSTSMYDTMFVEKKLVHSICMWAFTGTWDFNLGAAFDAAVEEVPLESQALLTPCNRRFVAFNPSTQPGGLVTWVYHFGTFIVAGADADVRLKLRCSGSYNCREEDGFEQGKCDCQAPREIEISPQNLPSRIKKNDIVNEEIFYTMQGGMGEGQIRYDQAYLEYTWKDGDKLVTTKTDPCYVGLTGGPGSVPGFCRYDTFTQSFRCQWGEAEGGVRFTGATVNYKRTIPRGKVFALGDNLDVTLQIQQDYNGKVQTAKHLEYDLLSSGGQELETNKNGNLVMLNVNGDYTKTIGTEPGPIITVKKEWFGTGTPQKFQASKWTSINQDIKVPNDIIQDAVLMTSTGTESTQRIQFVLELTKTGGTYTYSIYKGISEYFAAKQGFTDKEGTPLCTGIIEGNTIACAPVSIVGKPAPFDGVLRITLTENRPADTEKIQTHISLNTAEIAKNPCTGLAKDRDVMSLNLKFVAYDSDNYGQPTDQISIDPLTGEDAVREETINVICATKDEVALLEQQSAGVMTPAEIVNGLETALPLMLSDEQNTKTKLDDLKSKVNTRGASDEIYAYMDILISNEQRHSENLKKYTENLAKTTDPAFAELTSLTGLLYNILRVPTEQEIKSPSVTISIATPSFSTQENIVYAAVKLKEKIAELKTKAAGGDVQPTDMLTALNDVKIIEIANRAIGAKQKMQSLLPKLKTIKEACPSGTTDKEGNYYYCYGTMSGPPLEYWTLDKTKTCIADPTANCWKLDNRNHCWGQKDDDFYKCESATTCPGNSFEVKEWKPVDAGYTFKLLCPTSNQKCCKTRITVYQDLVKLRNSISSMIPKVEDVKLKELQDMLDENTDAQLVALMFPPGGDASQPAPLIKSLVDYRDAEQSNFDELKKQINALKAKEIDGKPVIIPPTAQALISGPISKTQLAQLLAEEKPIPLGIPDVIDVMNEVRDKLAADNTPTAPEIKKEITYARSFILILKLKRATAIAELEKEVGPTPEAAAAPTPAPVSLCGNGVVDSGEICDTKDGKVVIRLGVYEINDEQLCTDFATSDCTDEPPEEQSRVSLNNGKCESCTTFMPRTRCYDDDFAGDSGASQWYGPAFTDGGPTKEALFYDSSNSAEGSNPCVRDASTKINWVSGWS